MTCLRLATLPHSQQYSSIDNSITLPDSVQLEGVLSHVSNALCIVSNARCSNHPCGVVDKTCHLQAQGFKSLAQFSKFAQEDLEERSFFFLHTSLDVFVPAYTAI